MTQLTWNSVGQRRYEAGIDRGVLYMPGRDLAVPWNGLTSVVENSATTVDPLYFNGIKYYDYVSRGDFQGTLSAFTYPPEFEIYDGVLESVNGIFVTGQIPTDTFHLSYRTMIGDDLDGLSGGYKIHLLYNLTAKPSVKTYSTTNSSYSAFEFSWELYSVPTEGLNLRPTTHIIFDTTKMHELSILDVEAALYGSEYTDPHVVSIDEFEAMTSTAMELQVLDHEDGRWSAVGSDFYIKKNRATEVVSLHNVDAEYIDESTYNITSDI